jgi:hypothetical protein
VGLVLLLRQLSCSHFCPQAKQDHVEQFLDFGFIATQILGCLAVAVGGRVESFGSLLGAAAEATSLASPILNSRKGIAIYRRGATLLARKMQPDHLKELAERLYDLRDTARIIPLAQVEIGDGSASGDWSPFPRFSHDNVSIWVRRSPEYKAVRGWVVFDFSSNPTFRARFVRFAAHSVIEAPDGTLWDITQPYTSRPHPFIRHPGTDEDFDYLRASAVMHVDHYF